MSALALLALESGDVFYGTSVGVSGVRVGEVVFNTSMTGYQEILTDPSYAGQLITLTYPHIGNTGVNEVDNEASKVFAQGLIIKNCVQTPSNYRANGSLSDFLMVHKIVGIADIDTRALTRLLRDKGALGGCIMTVAKFSKKATQKAISEAQNFAGLAGMDLVQTVSTPTSYKFNQGSYQLQDARFNEAKKHYKVAVYDYGVKKNMLRLLVDADCDLTVYPAKTAAAEILASQPDGVFLSNGPGDPEPCDYAIANIKILLDKNIPTFGICLGHQLLALANGGRTEKMKFGHHGGNHPVQNLSNKQVAITSQNHGFAICEDSIGENLVITHRSLFDGSIQGIKQVNKPAFGFQGHPEASPGPHDARGLFNEFTQLMS